jgi:hypothetical protein
MDWSMIEKPVDQQEPYYDAVTTSPYAYFLAFSPFIGAAIGAYLLHRGEGNLLVSVETLERMGWLAGFPIERFFMRSPQPILLELLLVANIFCLVMIAVGIPFSLAPRPIIARRFQGKFGSLIVINLLLATASYGGRLYCGYLASEMFHSDDAAVSGRGIFGFVALIPISSVSILLLLSAFSCAFIVARKQYAH